MTNYFFKDIQEFKQFIGGGANVNLEMDSIGPVILLTAQKYLLTWLGKKQWEQLLEAFDEPSEKEAALLPMIQQPLALLSLYEYAQIGGIQLSEQGIFRIENDHHKSAYKYQENEYKTWMLENGYESIETMLQFLEEKEADYPLWQSSRAYTKNKQLFINYAAEFRAVYSQYISRYTFDALRPLVEDLEFFAILPTIGQTLFDELKVAIGKKNLSEKQQALILLIQKALANFTIEEGSRRHWVRIEGINVVQTGKLEPQSYEKSSAAANNAMSVSLRHHDEFGNRHLSFVRHFLTQNINDFPAYKAFLENQTQVTPNEEVDPTDHCGKSKPSQSIVRF